MSVLSNLISGNSYLKKLARTKLQVSSVGMIAGLDVLLKAQDNTQLIIGAVILVASLLGYTIPQGYVDAISAKIEADKTKKK